MASIQKKAILGIVRSLTRAGGILLRSAKLQLTEIAQHKQGLQSDLDSIAVAACGWPVIAKCLTIILPLPF